jgi:hypothetical protein
MSNPLDRVPYFMFVDREYGIDADASKEKGYEVPKMITFILITPHGHKGDPLEFFADEYLERKAREVKEGRYNPTWVQEFKAGLAAFREGKMLPRNGTPIVLWERITKTRREQIAQRFPTIEDLAAVPDSSLGDIGIDGRVLRDLAKGDIQAKKDLSPIVKELADTKEENRRLQEQLDKVNRRLDALDAITEESPRRGRPRKEMESA